MCNRGPDISTPIRNFECRAWRQYHRQWMVIMDSFCSLILPCFFRIGVNGCRYYSRRPVVTLRMSYRPFEDLRAGLRVSLPSIFLGVVSPSNHSRTLSAPFESLMVRVPHHDPEHGRRVMAVSLSNRSNRFMAQTAPEPHLMLPNDNFLDRLMSDRG